MAHMNRGTATELTILMFFMRSSLLGNRFGVKDISFIYVPDISISFRPSLDQTEAFIVKTSPQWYV